tara:strand:- start:321 stop:707 length:387 start_codon:yes stop_codon:yes gene_type:complete
MTLEKNLNDFLPDKKSNYSKFYKDVVSKNIIKEEEVIDCIKTVMDPEIPVNLYDLGLIYKIDIKNNNIEINMTLTNPNCPVAGQMPENVGKSLEILEGLKSVKVYLVWEPKWDKEFMSEDAKLTLDIF